MIAQAHTASGGVGIDARPPVPPVWLSVCAVQRMGLGQECPRPMTMRYSRTQPMGQEGSPEPKAVDPLACQ